MREERTIRILLTRGLYAVIDAADEASARRYSWHANRTAASRSWYAWTEIPRQGRVAMHRLLLSPGPGMEVDHIDGIGLNNTRANLRLELRGEWAQLNFPPDPTTRDLPRRVLLALIREQRNCSVRELARISDVPAMAVHAALPILVDTGLITCQIVANTVVYRARRPR